MSPFPDHQENSLFLPSCFFRRQQKDEFQPKEKLTHSLAVILGFQQLAQSNVLALSNQLVLQKEMKKILCLHLGQE
jgi:hypothetical protein